MKLLTLIDKISKLFEKREQRIFTYGHYNGQIKSSRKLNRAERIELADLTELIRQANHRDELRSN